MASWGHYAGQPYACVLDVWTGLSNGMRRHQQTRSTHAATTHRSIEPERPSLLARMNLPFKWRKTPVQVALATELRERDAGIQRTPSRWVSSPRWSSGSSQACQGLTSCPDIMLLRSVSKERGSAPQSYAMVLRHTIDGCLHCICTQPGHTWPSITR
jgi:hypothetical protein